jgi:hypothetical protein
MVLVFCWLLASSIHVATPTLAETIWFDKWWGLQNATTQATFRSLVARGQLEFVGGGYVQSDEATTTFADVIDQTTTGHEVLRKALPGLPPPKHGWQVTF